MEQCGNAVSVGGNQRTGRAATFRPHHPGLPLLLVWARVTGSEHHGTGLGVKTSAGWKKKKKEKKEKKRVYSCAAIRMMWQINSSAALGKDLWNRILFSFNCWRSSELLDRRVSCVIISWLSPAVAHTEGSRREEALTRRDRGTHTHGLILNYWSISRHGSPSHPTHSTFRWQGAVLYALLGVRVFIVKVGYLKYSCSIIGSTFRPSNLF